MTNSAGDDAHFGSSTSSMTIPSSSMPNVNWKEYIWNQIFASHLFNEWILTQINNTVVFSYYCQGQWRQTLRVKFQWGFSVAHKTIKSNVGLHYWSLQTFQAGRTVLEWVPETNSKLHSVFGLSPCNQFSENLGNGTKELSFKVALLFL